MVQPINSDNINQIKTKTSKATNKVLEAIEIEVIVLFFVILIVLLVLNYFSILPLSQKFPKIFGFLPTKNMVVSMQSNGNTSANSTNTVVPTQDLPQELFVCPVRSQCVDGRGVYDKTEKKVKGLGYLYIEEKTKLFAIIDGKASLSIKDGDSGKKIAVISTENNEFRVTYEFSGKIKGDIKDGASIKQDEIIGDFDGGNFLPVDFTSQKYSLYITVQDLRSDQIIPLIPRKDKPGLTFY